MENKSFETELEKSDSNKSLKFNESTQKFFLEFDEIPSLIFVAHGDVDKEELYIHGFGPNGWTGIDIHSEVGAFTTYKMSSLAICKEEDKS